MLKIYIFWGGFIVVMLGIAATLVGLRERGRRLQNSPPAGTPIPPPPDRRSSAAQIAGTFRLMCVGGSHHGHLFEIPPRGLSIGRARDNDLVIVDGCVAAHHAWLGVVDGCVILRDYQSLHGTFLNGDLDAPVSEATLAHGDTMFFGGPTRDQFQLVIDSPA